MDRSTFTAEPVAAFVGVIRTAGSITTASIWSRLTGPDLDLADVKAAWNAGARSAVKAHPQVEASGQTYRWLGDGAVVPPPTPRPRRKQPVVGDHNADLRALAPEEALGRLLKGGRFAAGAKEALADAIRVGLAPTGGGVAPPDAGVERLRQQLDHLTADNARLEAMLRDTHHQQVSFRAAQDRQLKIDVMRALAELAMEVEELLAGENDPDVVIERVRIAAETSSLEPIGQVGEEVAFDPVRHSPLTGFPDAGSPVSVVRPGYTWHADGEDVLLGKAVVA